MAKSLIALLVLSSVTGFLVPPLNHPVSSSTSRKIQKQAPHVSLTSLAAESYPDSPSMGGPAIQRPLKAAVVTLAVALG